MILQIRSPCKERNLHLKAPLWVALAASFTWLPGALPLWKSNYWLAIGFLLMLNSGLLEAS